jgi:hypothetical protein
MARQTNPKLLADFFNKIDQEATSGERFVDANCPIGVPNA